MIHFNAATYAMFFIAFHMIGDYVTQTNGMARYKMASGWPENRPWFSYWPRPDGSGSHILTASEKSFSAAAVRTIHVLLYSLPFLALGIVVAGPTFGAWLFAAVFVPHWIIDCRRWASPEPWPPKPIMVDQALHALHLAIVFAVFFGTV